MKKELEKIYREIMEFCGAEMPFTKDQCEYIKKSLQQAYLEGKIEILKEEANKIDNRG